MNLDDCVKPRTHTVLKQGTYFDSFLEENVDISAF